MILLRPSGLLIKSDGPNIRRRVKGESISASTTGDQVPTSLMQKVLTSIGAYGESSNLGTGSATETVDTVPLLRAIVHRRCDAHSAVESVALAASAEACAVSVCPIGAIESFSDSFLSVERAQN